MATGTLVMRPEVAPLLPDATPHWSEGNSPDGPERFRVVFQQAGTTALTDGLTVEFPDNLRGRMDLVVMNRGVDLEIGAGIPEVSQVNNDNKSTKMFFPVFNVDTDTPVFPRLTTGNLSAGIDPLVTYKNGFAEISRETGNHENDVWNRKLVFGAVLRYLSSIGIGYTQQFRPDANANKCDFERGLEDYGIDYGTFNTGFNSAILTLLKLDSRRIITEVRDRRAYNPVSNRPRHVLASFPQSLTDRQEDLAVKGGLVERD